MPQNCSRRDGCPGRSFPSLSSNGDPCARLCFPKNSTDVGRKKQFPTPCTSAVTGTRSAGASVGYMMPSSVFTDTSTTLRVRFQDRWSTSHCRTRVSASSSSVVHHFPGTKVQDVRPSRSIREEAFPRTNFLFVRSQRERGSEAHIFRVGRVPQSPLASPFVPPSFSCSYSLSFSKRQK